MARDEPFIYCYCFNLFFFFNYTATTEIYTLSLHDALPILFDIGEGSGGSQERYLGAAFAVGLANQDRKSTRLNSSHTVISYAVFCLKKKTLSQSQVTYLSQRSSHRPDLFCLHPLNDRAYPG